MFDIHSHILPGLDDGAPDPSVAWQMAKSYVDQGVSCVACTPHILPGVYPNSGPGIRQAVKEFSAFIAEAGLSLQLVPGADNHMVPDFSAGLQAGRLLTLADTNYVLVEPPHHVAPARLKEFFFDLQVAGYLPILTHPERLSWIEEKYAVIAQLADSGIWMQVTSGSLCGAFGRRARYWAERMIGEGLVHVVASDAHNMKARPPDLAGGYAAAERLIGSEQAKHLFITRPRGILFGVSPSELPTPQGFSADEKGVGADGIRGASEKDTASAGPRAGGGFGSRLRRFFGE